MITSVATDPGVHVEAGQHGLGDPRDGLELLGRQTVDDEAPHGLEVPRGGELELLATRTTYSGYVSRECCASRRASSAVRHICMARRARQTSQGVPR